MSSDASIDIRAVIFINRDAEEQYRGLPDEVRQSADARTSAMQNRQRLARKVRESLKGKLNGIDEIRIGFDGDTNRCLRRGRVRGSDLHSSGRDEKIAAARRDPAAGS